MGHQWAQVTSLDNSDEYCDNAHCKDPAIVEYAFDDSVFYYCESHYA